MVAVVVALHARARDLREAVPHDPHEEHQRDAEVVAELELREVEPLERLVVDLELRDREQRVAVAVQRGERALERAQALVRRARLAERVAEAREYSYW